MTVLQYLSKYLFEKYEDEAIFDTSQCGLPVSTSMNPKSVSAMFGGTGANITLTSLIIIYNYIIYSFVKRAILPEGVGHNLGTGYMGAE